MRRQEQQEAATAFEQALEKLPKVPAAMISEAAYAWASGYSLPLIVIESASQLAVLATDFQDDDGKRFWLSTATDTMLESGADRYGFVMEAWVAPEGPLQPRDHPQRKTNFVFGGVTRDSRACVALSESGVLLSSVASKDDLKGSFYDLLPPASPGSLARELARERLGLRRRAGKIFELECPIKN